MKTCSKCRQEKPKSEFNKNSHKRDGLQTCCRDCTKISNSFSYKHSEKRRKSIRANNIAARSKNLKLIRRYKSFCKCLICKESDHAVLDLHHLNSADKEYNPSFTVSLSKKRMKAEIRKCVVLCANCHRRLHAGQFCLTGV